MLIYKKYYYGICYTNSDKLYNNTQKTQKTQKKEIFEFKLSDS